MMPNLKQHARIQQAYIFIGVQIISCWLDFIRGKLEETTDFVDCIKKKDKDEGKVVEPGLKVLYSSGGLLLYKGHQSKLMDVNPS